MTSKNSTNKISLWAIMREDLRHRVWMIALSLLGSFLASPVTFLLFNDPERKSYLYVNNITGVPFTPMQIAEKVSRNMASYLTGAHLVTQMVILMFGAVIVAVFGFRHLYSRRMGDLCHSIPVTRNRLFLAYWLNGFLIWLAPFLAGNLCVYLMMLFRIGKAAYFGIVSAAMLKLILLCILCFLIVYNSCLVAVMLSGNLMNALLNLLLYGLIVFAGNAVIVGYMDHYFRNSVVTMEYLPPAFIGLSPLASPIVLAGNFANENVFADWFLVLLVSTVFLAVNFALSLWLHKRRASELAERGLEARWFRIPMRFAASFLAGLLLAMFFDSITQRGAWCLFGALFGSILAFAVTNIIYHGGFKYLFAHKIQLALVVVSTCCVIWIFRSDAFGYDAYLPDVADIKGCSLYSDALTGDSYHVQIDEDGDHHYHRTYNSLPSENYRFTDPEAIHRLLELLTRADRMNYSGGISYVTVRVYTTHGSYLRKYCVHHTAEDIAALKPLVENDSYRECYFPASGEDWALPTCVDVNSLDNSGSQIEDPGRIRQLHEAYRKDFLANYSIQEASCNYRQMNLGYDYKNPDGSFCHITLPIGENFSETLALLKKWYPDYIWTRDDLTLSSLDIEIYADANDRDSIDRYFGLQKSDRSDRKDAFYWHVSITDPEELDAWKPYLILGNEDYNFSEIPYAYIGGASFLRRLDDYNVYTECRVESGTVPAQLLDRLWERLQKEEPEPLPDYFDIDAPYTTTTRQY